MKKIFLALLVVSIILLGIKLALPRPTDGDILFIKPKPPQKTADQSDQTTKPPPGTELWIPVLVYHRIGYAPAEASDVYKSLTIEPEWFEKHLHYLQEHGFTAVRFSDVAEYFKTGKPLPKSPVMINFDDGYKDFYENALPLLKKYKMTGTLFMVSGYIGYPAYLNLDQLKEARDAGIEIGAHSMTHAKLTKVENAREEITKSKQVLEEKLGIKVTTFAYPYGLYNDEIEQMVRDGGYETGRSFTTGNGISTENLFHIPVVRVYANVGLERWQDQLFPQKGGASKN